MKSILNCDIHKYFFDFYDAYFEKMLTSNEIKSNVFLVRAEVVENRVIHTMKQRQYHFKSMLCPFLVRIVPNST